MDYSRAVGVAGEYVDLRAALIDSQRNLITPDSTPVLYIYDESIDSETLVLEMEAGTYDSAIAGPLTATLLSTGYYSYRYLIPTSYEAGTWYDVWRSVVNGIVNQECLSFIVEEEIVIDAQTISANTMLVVELTGVENIDNTVILEDTNLFYTTTYSPLYGSPDLVRAELGPWIDYIPDDTLALMLHWSSKEAQFIQGRRQESYGNIELARTKFVVYDAALRAVNQPNAGQPAGTSSGGEKTLGDLSIKKGNLITSIDPEILSWLRKQRQEWWRVVNDGGNIVPGQGLGPGYAIKGELDPDRRLTGRLWETNYRLPLGNTKILQPGQRRGKWTFGEK